MQDQLYARVFMQIGAMARTQLQLSQQNKYLLLTPSIIYVLSLNYLQQSPTSLIADKVFSGASVAAPLWAMGFKSPFKTLSEMDFSNCGILYANKSAKSPAVTILDRMMLPVKPHKTTNTISTWGKT